MNPETENTGPVMYRVANVSQVQPGDCKVVYVNRKEIVLLNYQGCYYALDNLCPHRNAPLCNGNIKDDALVCPRHGARFDLETGKGLPGPHRADIASYPVTIENGDILIRDPL